MNDPRQQMMQMTVGYWVSKAVYCAARAGVADALAAGPRPVSELAEAAGVDPENLHRLLRALASVGVFTETAPQVFGLTPQAEFLRTDHPQSMRHFALMAGDDLFEAWCDLYHALESGGSAVEKRFGQDFFSEISKDAQKSHVFDLAMQEIHGCETELMLAHHDFSRYQTVLDVGGGNGSTLQGILAAHPHLQGQLFELPQVIEDARALLSATAVAERVEFLSGDFFEAVPGDADCVILRHVLHDWSDEDSAKILRNSSGALRDGGSLLIVEKAITAGNAPDFAKLLDLNMMAIGGKERTEAQYQTLLESAQLRLDTVHVLPGPTDIVEARRA
jgi:SAM-dependent methyltransferase